MIIRTAKQKDVSSINSIFDLYWEDDFRLNLTNKLNSYFEGKLSQQNFEFFVGEKGGEVVGVLAYRKAPHHMLKFTSTTKPAELYVIAARERQVGIGGQMRKYLIQEVQQNNFTEIVFFSGELHEDSWDFHDNSSFKRLEKTSAPNGELGYIWRMNL